MEDHSMGVTVALAVALIFPSSILSQAGAQAAEASSEQAVQQAPKQTTTPQAQSAVTVPDLTGVWSRRPPPVRTSNYPYALTEEEPPMRPWAEAKYEAARPSFGPHAVANPDDPTFKCFPPGVPRIYFHPVPMEIIQIPGRVIMLFEYDHFVRQIYTDGRQHPKDMPATWMGDSIGRWEGGTLVVDTIGFNDKTWLDRAGHPHSDALHVMERFRRVDRNTLQDDVTIDDPKAYTKPWGGQLTFQFEPDWNLMEMICAEGLQSNDSPDRSAAEPNKSAP